MIHPNRSTNDNNNDDSFLMSTTTTTTEYEGFASRRFQTSLRKRGLFWFGLLLVVLSIVVLVGNEGRNVHRFNNNDLQQTRRLVAPILISDTVNDSNNGKLVYLTGTSDTNHNNHDNNYDNYLYDSEFGLQVENAVKLRRIVETYQWVETTIGGGGGGQATKRTSYYEYSKEWNHGLVNSHSFYISDDHQNPEYALYEETEYTADVVSLGPFTLSNEVVSRMNWYKIVVTGISADTVQQQQQPDDNDNNVVVHISQNYYYFGDNPSVPQVGDTRVRFEMVPWGSMSIIAAQQQQGNYYELVPYYNTSWGGTVLLVEEGIVSTRAMIAHNAELGNTLLTWGLRGVGLALSSFGLFIMCQPLTVVYDIVPIFGDLVDLALGCLSFVVATMISATVIGIAWLFYRPVISGTILLLIGGVVYLLWKRSKVHIVVVEEEEYRTKPPPTTHDYYDPFAGTSPHYPSLYQEQYLLSSSMPFAQVLDTQFAQQTSTSPALNAPVLPPPAVLPNL